MLILAVQIIIFLNLTLLMKQSQIRAPSDLSHVTLSQQHQFLLKDTSKEMFACLCVSGGGAVLHVLWSGPNKIPFPDLLLNLISVPRARYSNWKENVFKHRANCPWSSSISPACVLQLPTQMNLSDQHPYLLPCFARLFLRQHI